MRVLVLGAGVVGTATAYYLARAGHRVTVIDRQPGPGLETSFANGGQISANHTEPWANPATPFKALRWLGRKDAPLLFRLRRDPDMWAWLFRFLGNCTAGRARINTMRAMRMALYSRRALAELLEDEPIAYDRLEKGILHIFRDRREYERGLRQAEFMTGLGCVRRPLDVAECVRLEPALGQSADRLAGGVYSPDDESGDAYAFTEGLAARARGMGVEFLYETAIGRLLAEGNGIKGAETSKGLLQADAYVVALGSYSPLLLRDVGINIPIYPLKGYSVTLPVGESAKAPHVSLIDDEYKMVYSRLGGRLRAAGTAELSGYDAAMNESRVRPLLERALALFPGCADPVDAEFWCGLRPKTPDSVPVIGKTPLSNLYLNTGHGTLGWTMACGSGRALADLICGREPEVDMNGLGMDRFG